MPASYPKAVVSEVILPKELSGSLKYKLRMEQPITSLGYEFIDRDSLGDSQKKPHSVTYKNKPKQEMIIEANWTDIVELIETARKD